MEYYILFLNLLLSCNVSKYNKPLDRNTNDLNSGYIVTKLDSIPKAYIIYVQRNDSVFKLVSLKTDINNCTKIITGNYYELQLASWLEPDKPSLIHSGGLHVYGVSVAYSDEKIVQDIFYAKNLKGLCVFETN